MTDPQENKLSMYRVVEKLLDDNSIIWNGTPAFVTTKNAFSSKIAAISTASQQQQTINTGIATDKKLLKISLINIAAPVAAAVIAYASQTNNNELLNAVNFTQSQLAGTRDDMLGDRCQIIHTKANANLLALAPYGITAPVLTTLQTAITTYTAKVPAPTTAKQSKKTATINIRNLFKETDVILKLQLDKLMLVYKTTNSDFYNNYIGAREIINLGATHTKMEVTVYSVDGSAIEGAYALLLQNNIILYSATSGADGKIVFPKVKPGTYALKAWGKKFSLKEETGIKFKAGKKVTRKVILLPGTSTPGDHTAISEGDLAPGIAFNIQLTNIKPTLNSNITIQATGSVLRVYVSTANNGLPADVYIDITPGTDYTSSMFQFAQNLGFGNDNKFLMVQNIGANDAHFKFTFDNLEE